MNPNPADTLGALLRQQRQTLSRQDVGLPETGKRRAPGLTLAEVAVLAGVSTRWLAQLEQDRLTLHEYDALKRLLNTLQLSRKEQSTWLKLAGWQPQTLADLPPKARRRQLQQATDAIRQPAYVLDHLWNPVCHNSAASQLFSHWLGKQAHHSNLLDYLLLDPHSRVFIGDWHTQMPKVLQHFLRHIEPYRDNDTVAAFIQSRCELSPLFAQHCRRPSRKSASRPMLMHFHPSGKPAQICQRLTLHIADSPAWQLVMWLPEKT